MNFLILGAPNVGKTSIYNIICEDSNNIIHETVGTTRDWHISKLKNNNSINIYDTPGIEINDNKFINKNFLNLIKEIDIFIYVVDYKNNSYLNDIEIINLLRKFNRDIILIVNKDDNYKQDKNLDSFGLKVFFYLSCSHKIGFEDLLSHLSKYKKDDKNTKINNYSIGLFGKTNVGKSTLLNKLVGYDRSIVSNKPKTTTDIVTSSYSFRGINYLIKDTAGLIKKNKIDKNSLDYFVTKKTISVIKDIDLNLFLIDVNQGFDSQSKKIFNIIYQKSNILIIIINKIDLIKSQKNKILSDLKKDINKQFSLSKNVFILPISTFSIKDIKNLKSNIHKYTFNVDKSISTSQINKWLKKAVYNKPHARIKGREVKFKYATQVSDNPLTIKIFSNFSKEISTHYRRFITNNFYEYFKIKSKHIRVIFSKSTNPFN